MQPADRDPHRQRLAYVGVVDEEDRVGAHERPVASRDATLAGPERDQARSVGRHGRVVVRNPEAARLVALPVRKAGQKEGATRIELGLKPRGVVANAAVSLRRHAEHRSDARHGTKPPDHPTRYPRQLMVDAAAREQARHASVTMSDTGTWP